MSITRAPCARYKTGYSPPASSGEALAAFGAVWTALIVAIGCPIACSLAMLCSTTFSTVGLR